MSDVPTTLRARIARDLKPVTPLGSASVRSLTLLPFATAALVGVPYVFGLRSDIGHLGPSLSWGLSCFELLVGWALVAMALRESIPGRGLPTRWVAAAIGGGLFVVVLATLATDIASPTTAPPVFRVPYALICFRRAVAVGLPAVLVAAALAARGLPLKPAAVGALYGLGAGLFADAGWRLFCDVSAPSHVLLAHGGAVLVLVGTGAALSVIIERLRASATRA
jgi:hypothetical protein